MFQEMRHLADLQKAGTLSKKQLAEKVAELRLPAPLAMISRHMPLIVISTMWIVPFVTTLSCIRYANEQVGWMMYALFAATPLVFILSFILTGIFWAQLSKGGIIEGKFPRLPDHPIYALRRIYGAAWTQVYYFKPLYAVCLAVPILKRILFRGFGYRGDLGVTVYPDSWVRDLPLIKVENNVYIANRCVVGTNLCVNDGSIIVGPCFFGANSMIGHLAVFGLGCKIGTRSELGVGSALGMRVTICERVAISPRAEINHACLLEDECRIGTSAVIGMKVKVGKKIEIKAGASIPPGAVIDTQADADRYFSSENLVLSKQSESLIALLREQLAHGPNAQSS